MRAWRLAQEPQRRAPTILRSATARAYTPTGINTVAITDVSTPALAPGEAVQESGVLNTPCDSIGTVTVTADSTGAVNECDEQQHPTGAIVPASSAYAGLPVLNAAIPCLWPHLIDARLPPAPYRRR